MIIWCKHVHRQELQKFLNFCAAHSPVKQDVDTKFQYFLFEFRLAVLVYGHVYIIYGHINKSK